MLNNIDLKNIDYYNSNKSNQKFNCFDKKVSKIELGVDISSNMIKLSKNLNSFKFNLWRCFKYSHRSMSLDLIYSNSIRDFSKKI